MALEALGEKKKPHFRLHRTIQIYMTFNLKTNSNDNIQVVKKQMREGHKKKEIRTLFQILVEIPNFPQQPNMSGRIFRGKWGGNDGDPFNRMVLH